jgi:iron complex transport system substrate-binding protein
MALVVSLLAGGCRSRGEEASGTAAEGAIPGRVVCLTPSSTETVAAVAGTAAIVGVDDYSTYPPQVASRPKVGDFLRPDAEAILRLEPDLVVLDAVQTEIAATLRTAGIRTLPLRMERVGDVRAGLAAIGEALGQQQRAAEVVAAIDRELEAVRQAAETARAGAARPRVLFVVDRELGGLGSMVAAGPDTYLAELIDLAGGENALADSPVPFPRLSAESVLVRAPDVILDAVHTEDAARATEDWKVLSSVPAVRDGRVHVLADTVHMHPGPRLGESLRGIARLIHGGPGQTAGGAAPAPAAAPP